MTTQLTHLTKSVIQQKYPDVSDYCQVQCSLADSKFEEKLVIYLNINLFFVLIIIIGGILNLFLIK